jgi:hypothetical protein
MLSSLAESLCDLGMVDRCRGIEEAIRPALEALDETDVLAFRQAIAKRADCEGALEEHLGFREERAVWLFLGRMRDRLEVMCVAFPLTTADMLVGRKAIANEDALVRVTKHIHDDVATSRLSTTYRTNLGFVKTQSQCPGPPTHQLVSSTCTTWLLRINAASSS